MELFGQPLFFQMERFGLMNWWCAVTPNRIAPAAVISDLNWHQQNALENRIKRGFPAYFRTQVGVLVRVSWSESEAVFKISNAVSSATTYTAKAAYRFIFQLNQMPETRIEL